MVCNDSECIHFWLDTAAKIFASLVGGDSPHFTLPLSLSTALSEFHRTVSIVKLPSRASRRLAYLRFIQTTNFLGHACFRSLYLERFLLTFQPSNMLRLFQRVSIIFTRQATATASTLLSPGVCSPFGSAAPAIGRLQPIAGRAAVPGHRKPVWV
jgi:hypothetical protein